MLLVVTFTNVKGSIYSCLNRTELDSFTNEHNVMVQLQCMYYRLERLH